MSDISTEDAEAEIFSPDIPDEALEAAACAANAAAYPQMTQIAFCTIGVCPGG